MIFQKLTWKSNIIGKILLTTKQIKLINKKKFAKTVLGEKPKTFVVHVTALKASLAGITTHLL